MRVSLKLALSLLTLSACALEPASDQEAEPEIAERSEDLFLECPKWPNGIAKVCWDPATVNRADFGDLKRRIMFMANSSWPAVANVEFTGWDTVCSSGVKGTLRIKVNNSTDGKWSGNARCGYANQQIGMNLNIVANNLVSESGIFSSMTVHEFGHSLGFGHEMRRSDFLDDASGGCRESNGTGNFLGTPADRNSIMAAGYCTLQGYLTNWDIVGAIRAYGPRTNAVRPLVIGYGDARGDHISVSTTAGIADVESSGYRWAYAQGWLLNVQLPGTMPLDVYWHAGRGDNVTFASALTERAVSAANYQRVRTEGYVFSTQEPGTFPLNQWWSPSREDHALVMGGTPAETILDDSGYEFVRTEGFVPLQIPYTLLWTYSNLTLDHLATKQASWVASDAYWAGYQFAGFDGAVWKFPWGGTRGFKNYWSADRLEHFALSSLASEQAAENAGYVDVTAENSGIGIPGDYYNGSGYLYPNSWTGLVPMQSWWSQSRQEHFTTISRGPVASSQGYVLVRTEGYGVPINE